MDFVVAGFGLGAVMMLLGFAVRDLGPLRYRGSEGDGPVRRQWSALCRTVGNSIVGGGFAICLVTLVLLAADAGDDLGARMVASASAIAVIGSGVWTVFAVRRFAEATTAYSSAPDFGRPSSPFGPVRRPSRPVAAEVWDDAETGPEPAEEPAVASEPRDTASVVPESTAQPEETADSTNEAAPAHEPTTVAEPVVTPSPSTTAAPLPVPVPVAVPQAWYASPLLADVGKDADAEGSEGFRSRLLADIETSGGEAPDTRGFASSVLADLATADAARREGSESGQVQRVEPEPSVPAADAGATGEERQPETSPSPAETSEQAAGQTKDGDDEKRDDVAVAVSPSPVRPTDD